GEAIGELVGTHTGSHCRSGTRLEHALDDGFCIVQRDEVINMPAPLHALTLQRVGPAAGCYEQSVIRKALASISCDDAFIGIDVCYERFCDELNVSLLMPCKV